MLAEAPQARWRAVGAERQETRATRNLAALENHPHPIITALIAVYVAVLIPTWRAGMNLDGGPLAVFLATAAGLAAMVFAPRRWWLLRIAVPLAVAAFVHVRGEGEVLTAWVAIVLVSAAWACADRPPLPLRKPPAPGADVVVAFLSLYAFRGFTLQQSLQPIVVLAIGPPLLLVTNGRRPAVGRWIERATTAVERFAVRVVLALAGLVLLGARLIARATFEDRAPGWSKIDEQLPDPRRARTRQPRQLRRGAGPVLVALCLLVVVAIAVKTFLPTVADAFLPANRGTVAFPSPKGVSAARLGVVEPGDPLPAAYAGDSWYPGFRQDMAWVTDERVAWRPLTVQRVLDVETPTVNVHDRVRDSWKAPDCGDCKRVTLWLYGGSGAFGLGQRDDHTIASELARAAAADGVALDVQNRGIPGEMHWRNSTRFAWDLASERKPDLAVFYEGAEEVDSEMELRSRNLGDTRAPMEAFATDVYDEVVNAPEGDPDAPDAVTYEGWAQLDKDPGKPGHLAASRYLRSLTMSDRTAQANEIPVRYFWQPTRYGIAGTQVRSDDLRGKVFVNAPKQLDDRVVDLSAVLRDVDEPVFSDDTNHNEVAAKLIAAAMWKELRPQVEQLAGS